MFFQSYDYDYNSPQVHNVFGPRAAVYYF